MSGEIETPAQQASWRDVAVTALRLNFFRVSKAELIGLGWKHLGFGLFCTWLVGRGRYWDNPRVGLLQHLGAGSVIYIFILSLFLWLVVWPMRPRHWSYFRVLTFVSLVSPPAVLYAIPVEKWVSLGTANSINAWFLAIVAAWRVALLFSFLRRLGELNWFAIIVSASLPLTVIVVTLTILNLDRAVFDVMGGGAERSPNDDAYLVLLMLTWLSAVLFIPLLICYLFLAIHKWRVRLDSKRQ